MNKQKRMKLAEKQLQKGWRVTGKCRSFKYFLYFVLKYASSKFEIVYIHMYICTYVHIYIYTYMYAYINES